MGHRSGRRSGGARQWLTILGELKASAGSRASLVTCCDGLPGLSDAINAARPCTTVPTCVIHLEFVPALRKIYTAVSERAAEGALDEFTTSDLGRQYPAVVRTWSQAWQRVSAHLTVLMVKVNSGHWWGSLCPRTRPCPASPLNSAVPSAPRGLSWPKMLSTRPSHRPLNAPGQH
ncbi:transposase [Streptomyces hiroshimensis]|uniref:transposase n=1 Tax=Streptomyces hiroshimensis TaxID=66424 RepID=UPI001672E519